MIIACALGLFALACLAWFVQTRSQVPEYQRVAAGTLRERRVH